MESRTTCEQDYVNHTKDKIMEYGGVIFDAASKEDVLKLVYALWTLQSVGLLWQTSSCLHVPYSFPCVQYLLLNILMYKKECPRTGRLLPEIPLNLSNIGLI